MDNQQKVGFVRGLRACAEMLESMDIDECAIVGVTAQFVRDGRPQDNVVRRTLDQLLARGDSAELDGFCAGLTDIAATADEYGDFSRGLRHVAKAQAKKR